MKWCIVDEPTPQQIARLERAADWPDLVGAIRRRELQLLDVDDGKCLVGVRVEPDLREFVVCAIEGSDVLNVGTELAAIARANGCKTVRMHTSRKGLHRLLVRRFPFVEIERVYRMVL